MTYTLYCIPIILPFGNRPGYANDTKSVYIYIYIIYICKITSMCIYPLQPKTFHHWNHSLIIYTHCLYSMYYKIDSLLYIYIHIFALYTKPRIHYTVAITNRKIHDLSIYFLQICRSCLRTNSLWMSS